MAIFISLIIISLLLSPHNLLVLLADSSQWAHQLCTSATETSSSWREVYQALSCGQSFNNSFRDLLCSSGLIHLLVVSGTHILILEGFLQKLSLKFPFLKPLHLPLLFIYALCCLWNPPVVRALVSHIAHTINRNFHFYIASPQVLFITGGILLGLHPNWWVSRSLQLSWIASFCINLPFKNIFLKYSLLFLCLSPIIQAWSPQHPLTIFINILLSPFISTMLFPLSLLAPHNALILSLTDFLWQSLEFLLLYIKPYLTMSPVTLTPLSLEYTWIFIFSLHFLEEIFTILKRRVFV